MFSLVCVGRYVSLPGGDNLLRVRRTQGDMTLHIKGSGFR